MTSDEAAESVWDYPRPPRVEATGERVQVDLAGLTIADSRRALRVLETSHPPVYYLPRADVDGQVLVSAGGSSYCEFKGVAAYYDLVVGATRSVAAAWHYPRPTPGYEQLFDHVAFYPGRVERARVDGEVVRAQEGDFYGGWITSRVRGPFKGGPGTRGW